MLKLIAAVDDRGGIGKDGSIPWSCHEDLKRFARLTAGSALIMGRATAESLPFWLKGRCHVVVSRAAYRYKDEIIPPRMASVKYVGSVEAAIEACGGNAWVIGGAEIYAQTIELAGEIHLTRIPGDFNCDRFFPAIPARFTAHAQYNGDDHTYTLLQ